ncbi:uncharacterized protein BX663DRAFT_429466, partial [Cokeromyces recurvatus]|uniref:uncharacterized protein n=1 Tax=Cokeromyces recurvatus TaxID=90255 RepID=UPI00221ECBA2
IAPKIDVVFALVVGRLTIARVPFVDDALDCFILISNADSSRNTQFVRKFMSVFSPITNPIVSLLNLCWTVPFNGMEIRFFQRKVVFISHRVIISAACETLRLLNRFNKWLVTSTTVAEGLVSMKLMTPVLCSSVKIHLRPTFFRILKKCYQDTHYIVKPISEQFEHEYPTVLLLLLLLTPLIHFFNIQIEKPSFILCGIENIIPFYI